MPDDRKSTSRMPDVRVFDAELVVGPATSAAAQSAESAVAPRPRRRKLPLVLLGLTCLSVYWAGLWRWNPTDALDLLLGSLVGRDGDLGLLVRRLVVRNGVDAAWYMVAMLGILMTHEMGHFLMSVRYRVAASWPFFLPLPISPIGTLGAVIGMDGRSADRRQIFDIGLAGPLAGLVVALPILWLGIERLDFSVPPSGPYSLDLPLGLKWAVQSRVPAGVEFQGALAHSQLNPFFMAGWVGLLITGLNMMPVSQLDGGHVIYGLFGRSSRWIARLFLLTAVAFIVFAELYSWSVMLILILIMGADHPPTRDDSVRLGWFRVLLGALSLLIPVLCFPPRVFFE
jgi:Zn-dependent protease